MANEKDSVNKDFFISLRPEVEKQHGSKFASFDPICYRSYVVSSTNYEKDYQVKFYVGDPALYIHVSVYKPLPNTKEQPKITGIQTGQTLESPFEKRKEEVVDPKQPMTKKEEIKDVISRIWDEYDTDKNGKLDKKETRKLIKDIVKNLGSDYEYTDEGFDQVFCSIDKDGSGYVEKKEMISFVKALLKGKVKDKLAEMTKKMKIKVRDPILGETQEYSFEQGTTMFEVT